MQRCLRHLLKPHLINLGGLLAPSGTTERPAAGLHSAAQHHSCTSSQQGAAMPVVCMPCIALQPWTPGFPCLLILCSALQVGTMVQEHREEVGRLHEYIQVSTPVGAAVPSAQSAAWAAAAGLL